VIDLSTPAANVQITGDAQRVFETVEDKTGSITYLDPINSSFISGQGRRRRTHSTSNSSFSFMLDAADMLDADRPFMEVGWIEARADCNKHVSMIDVAGNAFLKYEYPAGKDDMGTSWRTTVSLRGVAPGRATLNIGPECGFALYPFITLYRAGEVYTTTMTSTTTTTTETSTTLTRTTLTKTSTTTTSTTMTSTTETSTTLTVTTVTVTTLTVTTVTTTLTTQSQDVDRARGRSMGVLMLAVATEWCVRV